MACTKWTCHKERSFASNYFLLSKILFQFKNLVEKVDLMYQLPKCSILLIKLSLLKFQAKLNEIILSSWKRPEMALKMIKPKVEVEKCMSNIFQRLRVKQRTYVFHFFVSVRTQTTQPSSPVFLLVSVTNLRTVLFPIFAHLSP